MPKPKHITIFALGSRGDVQPYIALGVGLLQAGYRVRLATDRTFATMVQDHGLEFAPIASDIRAILQSEAGREMLERGNNPVRLARGMWRQISPLMQEATFDSLRATIDTNLLLLGGAGFFAAFSLAEYRRLPMIAAHVQPLAMTRAFPSPLLAPPPIDLGPWGNLLTHFISQNAFWLAFRHGINTARQKILGLPPVSLRGPFRLLEARNAPVLHAYSPLIVPRPADFAPNIHITGYWFLDTPPTWEPPPALRDFLRAGPPPVYIGFGSMNTADPHATGALVLAALERTGQRGILLSGWGGISATELPKSVYLVDNVPHDWLFPRMAAVVHHGGAGTTAAGLRAGVPSLLVPFFADQPFWAKQVARLGVGPRPIPQQELTVDRLADAIHIATTQQGMRARAALIGKQLRQEQGIANAIAIVQRTLETWSPAWINSPWRFATAPRIGIHPP